LWREALSLEEVGVHDNFFDLGGHSLACIQVISRLETASGVRLDPRWLLLNTLEQVAAQLEENQNRMGRRTISR
jgi:acyl carrier protein